MPSKQQPPNKSTPGTKTCRPCKGTGVKDGKFHWPCNGRGWIIV